MESKIVRVTIQNYSLFQEMVVLRMTGNYEKSEYEPEDEIKRELLNPNFYLYAVQVDEWFVGWISLIYLPKVGRYQGHGHIYVDELWVHPQYRRQGLAKALLSKADELVQELQATGVRLYVNEENPGAEALYEKEGFHKVCRAYFMEKE